MDPAASATIGAASEVVDLYGRLKKHFTDFRPETRSMTINFADCTSEMSFKVTVQGGWRKQHQRMAIPAYDGFEITGMLDDSFNEHKHLWRLDGGKFMLDAKSLPAAETYMVTMKGRISRSALDQLVYIKPAAGRTSDGARDRYWLESGLRNLRTLESIYDDLEVDGVGFDVSVGIDRMFTLAIPPDVLEQARAADRLRRAALQRNRQEWFHAMRMYRAYSKRLPGSDPRAFARLVDSLVSRETIAEYVAVDPPYALGTVRPPERYHGLVPQSVTVGAVTSLTLRSPSAKGYLSLDRESYVEKLRSGFADLGGG